MFIISYVGPGGRRCGEISLSVIHVRDVAGQGVRPWWGTLCWLYNYLVWPYPLFDVKFLVPANFWRKDFVAILKNYVDKYGSKHTGSQTNIQTNIGGTYGQIRTDGVYIREGTFGVYIREGKYTRRHIYENSTFERTNISLVRTNIIISKTVSIRGTKTKLLSSAV